MATLQWQHIDMGLLNSNEQRITTFREGEFFTTTNYVYEVDIILLNLSYTFNKAKNKSKFIDSEFGEREFLGHALFIYQIFPPEFLKLFADRPARFP